MKRWLKRASRSVTLVSADTTLKTCWAQANDEITHLILFRNQCGTSYLLDRLSLSKALMVLKTPHACLSDLDLPPAEYLSSELSADEIEKQFRNTLCDYLLLSDSGDDHPYAISAEDFYSFLYAQEQGAPLSEKPLLESLSVEFADVFQNSPIAMSISEPDTGRFVEVNHVLEQITGFRAEELVGRVSIDVGFYQDMDDRNRVMNEVLNNGPAHLAAFEFTNKQGLVRVFKLSTCSVAIRGEEYLLSMILDDTERHTAELALLAERDLLASGPVTVLISEHEAQLSIRYATGNLNKVLGYEPDEVQHRNFRYLDIVHPQDRERVIEEFEPLLSGASESEMLKYRVIDPNGDVKWIRDCSRVFKDEERKAEFVIRRFLIDITWQMNAERHQRLAASVFAHAHEGIVITDARARIVDVNPTYTEITGYTRVEAIGKPPSLVKSGHQNAAFYRNMWRSLRTGGKWQGEIVNQRKDGSLFVALATVSAIYDEQGQLQNYINTFSDISVMKEHQQQLEKLAHHDALTGLPNRVLLGERMKDALYQASGDDTMVAICYLDLDGFKEVNDIYGHESGDQLLIEIGRRLKLILHGRDTVARLGGDEFVLLIVGLKDTHAAETAAERVLDHISRPVSLSGQEVQVSGSIGIVIVPCDASDPDLLIRQADQAMYSAKLAGRNGYQIYDPMEDEALAKKNDLVQRVSEGIYNNEFELYFQPQVNLPQRLVVGAEALVRWQHPERGLLNPGQFLPHIEDTDVEIELDHWVLQEACRLQRDWQHHGETVRVSVNIAGRTFVNDGFVDYVRNLLAQNPNIQRGMLELEILETAALVDMDHANDVFIQCQQMGLCIALDDFGTGYSSLTYFRRLPAETLKIDQSFVRDMLSDPEDKAIVESVVGLAKAFNKELVAEGVELPEQGKLLVELGCPVLQGYGIARPMPADQLLDWIEHWQPEGEWLASRTNSPVSISWLGLPPEKKRVSGS